jgi:hypothetical protein
VDNPVLRAALDCADKGWPVFPCHSGRELAAIPNGHLDATTDSAQVREWFAGRPELNLAVATGAPGPDVLAIDLPSPQAADSRALWRLRRAGLVRGASRYVDTPDGVHLYFDGSAQPSDTLPAWNLRFIARGGYVLVPRSRLGQQPYKVAVDLSGEHSDLDWNAAARLLDPARAHERPSDPEPAPEPPDPEAGT